jgi:hypothetical protein
VISLNLLAHPMICFSLPEKPTTIRLTPDVAARFQDDAKRRGWSFNKFGCWLVGQIVELELLEPANREFVRELLAQLSGPWTALDVINALVTAARREISSGKLKPMFWSGQIKNVKKIDAVRGGVK